MDLDLFQLAEREPGGKGAIMTETLEPVSDPVEQRQLAMPTDRSLIPLKARSWRASALSLRYPRPG